MVLSLIITMKTVTTFFVDIFKIVSRNRLSNYTKGLYGRIMDERICSLKVSIWYLICDSRGERGKSEDVSVAVYS